MSQYSLYVLAKETYIYRDLFLILTVYTVAQYSLYCVCACMHAVCVWCVCVVCVCVCTVFTVRTSKRDEAKEHETRQ